MAVKVTDIDNVERTLPEVKEVGQRIEKRVGDEEKRAVQAEEALRTSLSEHEKAAEESFEEVNFALQAEIDRAKSAEQNLNTAIQNESERAQGAESSLKSSIEEEKNRATSAESVLQESINTEVSRAKKAEEALGKEISSEADRAKGEESRIEGLLQDEVSRAQEAESVLAQDIEEEKNRAEQVEASLTSAISQEQEQRILGDTTLDSKIDKEIQDRQSGDSQNSQAIQAEATRAQEAESALQANIDAEESRATQVEGQLSTRITSIEEKIPNQASSTNQLADKAFVNSSIQQMAANRVTYDAQGSPFPTRAILLSSQTYYHNGVAYTPDEHDYALVTADEGAPTPFTGGQTRFEWTGSGWEYAYGINERPFTSEEWAAIESGITAEKVAEIGTKLPINNTTNSLYGTDSGGSQVMVPRSSFATSAQGQKADTAYQKPEGGIPKTDLDSSVQGSLNKADSAYQKPTGGITESDLSQSVNASLDKADSAYQKPVSGIPKSDLASDVQESLDSADSAYHKPEGGITESDLSSSVNVSLDKADTAYQKPSAGIPKSDLDTAVQEVLTTAEGEPALRQAADTALGERIDDILDGTTPIHGWATEDEIKALFNSFGLDSWSRISEISESGKAQEYFSVGDEKTIELTTGEQVTLVILGFNHDDLSDGSGKAGMSIGMKNLLAIRYAMNSSGTNAGGWDQSEMRTSTMATLFSQLPSDLQGVIKQVNKKATAGGESTSITTSADKLWLFSEVEIDGTTKAGYAEEGEQYKYWQTVKDGTFNADRIKYLANGSGSANTWWLRSPYVSDTRSFRCIGETGDANSTAGAKNTLGMSFGFCV